MKKWKMISKGNKVESVNEVDALIHRATVPTDKCLRGVIHLNPCVNTAFDPKLGPHLTWVDDKDFGVIKRLIFRSPPRKSISLDQIGCRTIELIDGYNSVDNVANILSTEFGTEINKTRAALLTFLTQLMKKNLITVVEA